MSKTNETPGWETVTIPIDAENPEAAFSCYVNRVPYKIRRGEPVLVPTAVAELVRDWSRANEEMLKARIKADRETRKKLEGFA
jgi:hypothetical protein